MNQPLAISLSCQNSTGQKIVNLWDAVAAFEDAPSMAALNCPPYITLAIYDDIDRDLVERAVGQVFREHATIELCFRHIHVFESQPMVLWAKPEPSDLLRGSFKDLHEQIGAGRSRAHYRPGSWVPHCSLGVAISNERAYEAREFAKKPPEEFYVTFDQIDVVTFPPVHLCRRWALKGWA